MMSLQSALVGFGLLKTLPAAIPRLLPLKKPFTPQENVILQTVAVATGTMPLAAGLVGIIPALEMMTPELDGREGIKLGYWSLVLWCLAGEYSSAFPANPLIIVAFFGSVNGFHCPDD